MKLVFNSKLARFLGVDAITLYPFIFFKDKLPSGNVVVHESTHFIQIERDGVLKFYCKYLYEYYKNRYYGMDSYTAYRSISYEIEARDHEITF